MKRVNIREGIKERINKILGSDHGYVASVPAGSNIPGITPWSIQAATIDNMRRITKSLVGAAPCGRVMSGLSITHTSATFSIPPGIGITKGGDVIVISTQISNITRTNNHIYLKHVMVEAPATSGGHKSQFIRGESQGIVYDDYASSNAGDLSAIVVQKASIEHEDNLLYLGELIVSGTAITNVTPTIFRGLIPGDVPTILDSLNVLNTVEANNIKVNHVQSVDDEITIDDNVIFEGDIVMRASKNLIVGGDTGKSTTMVVQLDGGGTRSLIFRNGILTSAT